MLSLTAAAVKSSDLRLYNLGFCQLSTNIAEKSVMSGGCQTSILIGRFSASPRLKQSGRESWSAAQMRDVQFDLKVAQQP